MPMFLFKNRYKIKYNIKKSHIISLSKNVLNSFLFKRIRKKHLKAI